MFCSFGFFLCCRFYCHYRHLFSHFDVMQCSVGMDLIGFNFLFRIIVSQLQYSKWLIVLLKFDIFPWGICGIYFVHFNNKRSDCFESNRTYYLIDCLVTTGFRPLLSVSDLYSTKFQTTSIINL